MSNWSFMPYNNKKKEEDDNHNNSNNNDDNNDTEGLDAMIEVLISKYGASAVESHVGRALKNRGAPPQIADQDEAEAAHIMNQSILDSSFDAIVVADDEGNIVKVNASMLQIFGFDKVEDVVGQNLELIVGEHAAMHRTYMKRFMEKGGSTSLLGTKRNLVAVRRDGTNFPVRIGIRKVVGTKFIVAFIQDITTEARAAAAESNAAVQAKQAEQETHLNQSILDSSFDAIVVSDDEGNIVKVNAAMLQIFGFDSVEEIVGQNLELIVGEHAAMHRHYMKAFLEKGGSTSLLGGATAKRQLVAVRKDKSQFPVRIGIRKVVGTEFLVAFIQDITHETRVAAAESNAALQAKQAQEEAHMNQSILDSSFDAIVVSDDEGNIVKVNAIMLKVFGFDSVEEVVGENLEILVGEHASMHRSYMKAFLEKGGSTSMLGTKRQLVATRRDGSEFPCKIGIRKVAGTAFIVAFIQDVTSEAKALAMEEAKRASANMNKSILDASFDAMVVTDEEGTIVKVNRAMLELFGYNSTKDVVGQGVEMLVGEHAAMHRQYMKKFKDEAGSSTVLGTKRQLVAQREDGSEFPCRIGIRKVPDTAFIVAFIQDISNEVKALKLAEANLASGRMNRSILDSSFDAFIVTDLEGNIVKVNAAMLQIFRYDRNEDIVGQNVEILVGPHAVHHRTYMKKFADEGGSSTTLGSKRELVATRSDGSEFPCKIGIRKVPETDFIVAFVQDLTSEANAEQSAETKQAAAQMNKSILDSSFDAVVVTDDEGVIVRVNKAMLKIFGFQKSSEVVGKNVDILVGEHAAQHAMYMKRFREREGSSTVLGTKRQLVAQRRDGTSFPCRIGIRKVDGTDFIVAFIQDISWEVNAIEQARATAAAAAVDELLAGTRSLPLGPIAEEGATTTTTTSVPNKLNSAATAAADTKVDRAILWDIGMDGIVLTNPDGIITKVNMAALRMFGYEEGNMQSNALLGQNIDTLLGYHTESYRNQIKQQQQRDDEEQPQHPTGGDNNNSNNNHKRLAAVATRRDKTEFPCQLVMSTVADTEFIVAFIQDYSRETKALERALSYFQM